ncbi:MAG: prepilin-type N-terminal cleavage/methylation domain-containing protein [Verrucomicrobiota bacterium]
MKTNMLNKKAGFSLVELLVVIAVIGIIAAIAVPQISKINESASQATAQRNAQNLTSVYASALAAGHDFAGGATDISNTIDAIVTGTTITAAGAFNGTFFGVPNLSTTDKTAAGSYVDFDATSGLMIYDKAGDSESQ